MRGGGHRGALRGEEAEEEERPMGGEGAESDLRAEHRAVVVDEAGADELVSRLGGSEAELDDSLLSCSRRGDGSEHTGTHTAPGCVCVCEGLTVGLRVRRQLSQRWRHARHLTFSQHLSGSLHQVLEHTGHAPRQLRDVLHADGQLWTHTHTHTVSEYVCVCVSVGWG